MRHGGLEAVRSLCDSHRDDGFGDAVDILETYVEVMSVPRLTILIYRLQAQLDRAIRASIAEERADDDLELAFLRQAVVMQRNGHANRIVLARLGHQVEVIHSLGAGSGAIEVRPSGGAPSHHWTSEGSALAWAFVCRRQFPGLVVWARADADSAELGREVERAATAVRESTERTCRLLR